MITQKINMQMASRMGLSDKTIRKIDKLQAHLDHVLKCPHIFVDSPSDVKEYIASIEFRLQELWGFNQDDVFHRYSFRVRHCTCPKSDNEDLVGIAEYRWITSDCPYHGTSPATSWEDERVK